MLIETFQFNEFLFFCLVLNLQLLLKHWNGTKLLSTKLCTLSTTKLSKLSTSKLSTTKLFCKSSDISTLCHYYFFFFVCFLFHSQTTNHNTFPNVYHNHIMKFCSNPLKNKKYPTKKQPIKKKNHQKKIIILCSLSMTCHINIYTYIICHIFIRGLYIKHS